MVNKTKIAGKVWMIFIGIIILSSFVYATSHLPIGLLKIQEYNDNTARQFLQNISFIIAFLAGMTSIVSPCTLPLLPAYFAITFKEKKRITLATFVFFLGFSSIFILMGVLATVLGLTLSMVLSGISWIVPAVGIILITFGIMILLGKGFPGISFKRKFSKNWIGIFLAGVFFAIGWSACTGPILSGILVMTSTFGNYLTAVYLMFAYSLGVFVPIFILSFFYDKFRLDKSAIFSKEINFSILGKKYHTNIPNVIAGIIFILFGLAFIVFKGTSLVNSFDMFGLRNYFYSWQDYLILNVKLFNIIGIIIFAVFILTLGYFLVKEIKNNRNS
jgi:cytochrome c-type biogenesis protein|tara:strand:+ start:4441 stop:5433 length:993 start_codon:yes stop_codon:yes gene_type:complete